MHPRIRSTKFQHIARLSLASCMSFTLLACHRPPESDAANSETDASDAGTSGNALESGEDPGSAAETGDPTGELPEPRCLTRQCEPGRDDCPEGTKCTPFSCEPGRVVDSTYCAPVRGDVGPRDRCVRDAETHTDDCGRGLYCRPDEGTSAAGGPGRCMPQCSLEPDGPRGCEALGYPQHTCVPLNRGAIHLCLASCEPWPGRCDSGDDVCYHLGDDYVCLSYDRGTPHWNDASPGNACYTEQGCAGGDACVPYWMVPGCGPERCLDYPHEPCGCCATICELGSEEGSAICEAQGDTCVPLLEPNPQTDHIGYCGHSGI